MTKIGNGCDIVKKMSELFSLAPIIHLVLENYCLLIISSSNSLCKRKICGFGGESKHLIGCLWWALRYLAVDKWIVTVKFGGSDNDMTMDSDNDKSNVYMRMH